MWQIIKGCRHRPCAQKDRADIASPKLRGLKMPRLPSACAFGRAGPADGFWLLLQGEEDNGSDEVEGLLLAAGGLGEDSGHVCHVRLLIVPAVNSQVTDCNHI